VTQGILAYSAEIVYPGRVAVQNTTQSKVILPQAGYWNINARFRRKDVRNPRQADYEPQLLYDQLKDGQTVTVDLHALAFPTIPVSLPVSGTSIVSNALELRLGENHGVENGQYVIYDGKLSRVFWSGFDRVRTIPGPDVNPQPGRLQSARSIDCWMPELAAPSTLAYPFWSEITLNLRTL